MDIAHVMYDSQPICSLSSYLLDFSLLQPMMLFQLIKNMPLRCEFCDYKETFFICEKTVIADDVLVLQSIVDSYFLCQLMLHFLLLHHFFAYYLQSTQEVSHFMPKSIDHYLAIQTTPNFPRPNSFIFSKSFSFIFYSETFFTYSVENG